MEKEVGAAKFKAQCLALLENLPEDGIVVTKHGRKLARVMPYREDGAALIGSLKHKVTVVGEIYSTGVKWDADD